MSDADYKTELCRLLEIKEGDLDKAAAITEFSMELREATMEGRISFEEAYRIAKAGN